MLHLNQVTKTFPSTRIHSACGGLPVEVSLIAQMGHGAGDQLFASVAERQRQHAAFIDELDEPSAKLGAPDFANNDPSSLYSFMVGAKGHPWHRHAGNRMFMAISGSGGTQLRFSTASDQQVKEDPINFVHALHFVNIPADCLFTVRFGGETWHQFAPMAKDAAHPTLFALSHHANELGGNLHESLKNQVLSNEAGIASLTETLPPSVQFILDSKDFSVEKIPITTLSLDAPAGTLHRIVCDITRSFSGSLRGAWARWKDTSGFLSNAGLISDVEEMNSSPENSLLREHMSSKKIHHEDTFRLVFTGLDMKALGATRLLALTLEGFVVNAPRGVSLLMGLRNALVKPLGLRTSRLGCPVSSLLSEGKGSFFAGKYPVLDQRIDAANMQAEVILGADDKHLSFRTCVEVTILDARRVEMTLGNRVHCKNLFGKIYMSAIDYTHRRYISPTMMRMAADYVTTHGNYNAHHS